MRPADIFTPSQATRKRLACDELEEAPLAQLDRASVYETEGYWFESSGVYFQKAASSHPLTRLFSCADANKPAAFNFVHRAPIAVLPKHTVQCVPDRNGSSNAKLLKSHFGA